MKQVPFKELELGGKSIVQVDNKAINRVIIITNNVDNRRQYYWLDADVTYYGISVPVLYELTKEEAEEYITV